VSDDPKLKVVHPETEPAEPISKPEKKFSLDKFKSKSGGGSANVETLQTTLPHGTLSDAKDFVRLHPDEVNYWSVELCFVHVPILGQKRDMLHMIDADVAARNNIADKKIQRFSLALASKPNDAFFLCHVPTKNLDNSWNESMLQACRTAKEWWVQATSQKELGLESYRITKARRNDAFPAPKWPAQPLEELIVRTFDGRMIEADDHPGLLRIVGDKQSIS
jgi:hypothetical protein